MTQNWRPIRELGARLWQTVITACFLLVFTQFVPGLHQKAVAQTAGFGQASVIESYRLGPGDKIRLNVFGEPDLSGEFTLDGGGAVRLPLIGQVKANGLAVHEFEAKIISQLQAGPFIKDPKVSVEVISYRPFYIIGEINKPGEYPYVNDMSVLNAVALAGGYTYRANERYVYLRREGISREEQVGADQGTKIRPGDIVRVPERFF